MTLCTPVPVSYTHLDVYKRQVQFRYLDQRDPQLANFTATGSVIEVAIVKETVDLESSPNSVQSDVRLRLKRSNDLPVVGMVNQEQVRNYILLAVDLFYDFRVIKGTKNGVNGAGEPKFAFQVHRELTYGVVRFSELQPKLVELVVLCTISAGICIGVGAGIVIAA